MLLSPAGKNLLKGFEGLSLTAYPDANGYSIGYGHFGASPGDTITREEADRLFDRDIAKFEYAVSTVVPNASQAQFDAMVSLAYNIGTGGFAGSTVARLHNMGDYQGAADAFRMWNKSQGKVHQGLVARREKERAFYLGGSGSGLQTPGTSPTHYPMPPLEQSTGEQSSPAPGSGLQTPEPEGWSPKPEAWSPESVVSTHARTGFFGALVLGAAWLAWRLFQR